jgi:hypothetical protein
LHARTDRSHQRAEADQSNDTERERKVQYQRRPQLAPDRSASRSTAPITAKTMPTVQRIGIPAMRPMSIKTIPNTSIWLSFVSHRRAMRAS